MEDRYFVPFSPLVPGVAGGVVDSSRFEQLLHYWLGRRPAAEGVHVSIKARSRIEDCIWIGPVMCVSENVIELLTRHHVTGVSWCRARVADESGISHDRFSVLSITGRCRRLSLDRESCLETYTRDVRGKKFTFFRGLQIDWASWDGSEVFCGAEGMTGYCVMSERVVRVLRDNGVTNVDFQLSSEVEVPAIE